MGRQDCLHSSSEETESISKVLYQTFENTNDRSPLISRKEWLAKKADDLFAENHEWNEFFNNLLNVVERDGEIDNPDKSLIESIMDETNTFIQWPSRLKIGAKTKKDLFVRIYGHTPESVAEAKQQIVSALGPQRDLRITLKLEISYTDHSHLIGCRGSTIRKVMDDSGCHIHFPDSNRMSKEHKSNQVTIAGGNIQSVEQARARVRELSPLIFQFSLPVIQVNVYDAQRNPDKNNIFIDNIQTQFNVQVTIHPPNKLQQTMVLVKGCELDAPQVMEAVTKIIEYFASDTPMNSIVFESTMEITPLQHTFVRAINDSNIHTIAMNTGAKIVFPDLSDSNIAQIKRSRIYIHGDLNNVYLARQQLIGCLPLRMIFDLPENLEFDWENVRQTCMELNVNVKLINRINQRGVFSNHSSLPPTGNTRNRTIQLIGAERNASSIYEARRRILGCIDDPSIAIIPQSYILRHVVTGPAPGLVPSAPPNYRSHHLLPPSNSIGSNGSSHHTLPQLLLPNSPNMISPVLSPNFWPPIPFSSPLISPTILFQPNGSSYRDSTGSMNTLNGTGEIRHATPTSTHSEQNIKLNGHGTVPPPGFGGSSSSSLRIPQQQHFIQQMLDGVGGTTSYCYDLNSNDPLTPTIQALYSGSNPRLNLLAKFDNHQCECRRAPGFERTSSNPN